MGRASAITGILVDAGRRIRVREEMWTEAEAGVMHFVDGGRVHGSRIRWPLVAGKSKETDSPLESPGGT